MIVAPLFEAAIAGIIVRRITGWPLIIELPIVPRKLIFFSDPRARLRTRILAFLYERAAVAVLGRANHIKLIFPGQLASVSSKLTCKSSSAFADFTPVHKIELSTTEKYLLLIGTPLYLKGADVAIRAFKRLLNEFPNERLVIVGSALGFKNLARLIGPSDPIELIDYLPQTQAIERIRSAKVVLIPSRTDAMPRVAVEALASGKAIVASRVDGMETYLKDGKTALLCAPENHNELATAVRRLLVDPELRRQLGANGRELVVREFSEKHYVSRFACMVRRCIHQG